MTPIVVTHREKLQFTARVGGHDVILDQSAAGGGDDAGPSPLDLLGAALGSCVALYVYKFLGTRHLSTEGLRVEVVQHSAHNPHRIARFEVRIVLPDSVPAVYKPMIEAVARVCPVHNTLAHSAEVAVAVESPTAAHSEVPEMATS